MNGIRPCASVNFAAGPTSSYGGDGNSSVCLPALGAVSPTSTTGESFESVSSNLERDVKAHCSFTISCETASGSVSVTGHFDGSIVGRREKEIREIVPLETCDSDMCSKILSPFLKLYVYCT